MNKKEFIKALSSKLNVNEKECEKINNVLESEFFIGNKNKEKIINKLCSLLDYNEEEAENIYNKVMETISNGIKDKLINPFK